MSETERKHLHQSLPPFSSPIQKSSDFRQFLDTLPDAVLLVNAQGQITMLNQQAERLFGYSQTELAGQALELLLPERFRSTHITHRAQYTHDPHPRPMGIGLQLFALHKDGLEIPVDISLGPFRHGEEVQTIAVIRDVTQQRRAERERAQQLQRLQLQGELINQAHDAILVRDPISRILLWNRGAEELYGWSAQQALGRVSHTLLKTRFSLSRSALEEQLEHDGVWEGELTHTTHSGLTVVVESRQVLIRDEAGNPAAILEINRNITERRRRDERQQAAYSQTAARLSFLQQILDTLPNAVSLVAGTDAHLVLTNRTAHQLWGATWIIGEPMQTFLTKNLIEILDPQGKSLSLETFATMQALHQRKNIHYHQEVIRRPDGSSLSVLVSALPLSFSLSEPLLVDQEKRGEDEGITQPLALVVYQDVTPLKEAEYLKDEFIGIAAHELRTPLAALSGFAETLLIQTERGHGPQLADWQQEALQEIQQATVRLSKLTDELLDVTRLQAGRLVLNYTSCNLVSLLQRLANRLQKTTTRHVLEILLPASPLIVHADAVRIEQVLTNLIENAIKYSPQGGPIAIQLRKDEMTHSACLSVTDHGIGIPDHQQTQIFGRFMRAENTQVWGIPGTGLGLYLSREVVELHRGQLTFISKVDQGSTFVLTLPLEEDSSLAP